MLIAILVILALVCAILALSGILTKINWVAIGVLLLSIALLLPKLL